MDATLNTPTEDPFNAEAYKRYLLPLITSNYSCGEQYCYSNTEKPEDGAYQECIHIKIKQTGPITLPLKEIDVARLKVCGEELEPHVWSLKAKHISFGKNRHWGIFREKIMNDAWQRLFPHENKPAFHLQKLLLCGPGSCVNPYSNPQPNDMSFANLEIVLPSHYTGGSVEVQFRDSTSVFDVESTSSERFSVLAWFSEALYKASPISFGHRLVLLYKVIHTSPGPVPLFSDMLDRLTTLRSSLRQWASAGSSQGIPHTLAFCLKGLYRGPDDETGVLTRGDAQRLQPEAEAFGFRLFVATLTYRLTGAAHNRYSAALASSGPRRWSKPYPPDQIRIFIPHNRSFEVDGFVDLEGCPHPDMSGWPLNSDEITLGVPLETCVPDFIEYEGSLNGTPGTLQHRLQLSVLCMITSHEYLNFLLRILPHKERSLAGSVAASDEKTAKFVVDRASWNSLAPSIPWLAYVALKVNDLDFWGQILDGAVSSMGLDRRVPTAVNFGIACVKFTFNAATARLEHALRNGGFSRLLVVANINVQNASTVEWYTKYTHHILWSAANLGEEEVDVLVDVATQDAAFFNNTVLPALEILQPRYDFCIELFGALDARRSEILPRDPGLVIIMHTVTEPTARSANVNDILENSLQLAILQWHHDLHGDDISRARAIQMLELCITTGRVDTCGTVLLAYVLGFALAPDVDLKYLFARFFMPFLRGLHELLEQFDLLDFAPPSPQSIDMATTPFSTFYRDLIKCYVRSMMGTKPSQSNCLAERPGCGCTTCEKLDIFFDSAEHNELHILGDSSSLSHVRLRVQMAGGDVATTLTSGPGQQKLVVAKQNSAYTDWRHRKADAVRFLSLVGDWRDVRNIMGDEHDQYLGFLDEPEAAGYMELDLAKHNDWF